MLSGARRVAAAMVVLLGAVALAPVPATAADQETRTYQTSRGGSITARCTGEACVLTADYAGILSDFLVEPLAVTGGTARVELPNTCGTSEDFSAARTLTLTLTETDLDATVVTEAGEWRVNEQICYARGGTETLHGTAVAPVVGTTQPTAPATQPSTPPVAPGTTTGAAASDVGSGAGTATTSRLATGEPDAPSVLSGLRTIADVDARESMLAALLTIVLVLLIAFPTTLLNSAADQGSDRFSVWWRTRRGTPEDRATENQAHSHWWWAAGGVLAAGVVSSFVDPQFGLNPGSVRTVLSILVGFAVEVVLGWLVVTWLVRRTVPRATASYTFAPLSLALVAAAVVFTRMTGFEPGIIFGLVAGVGFTALVGAAAEARATLAPLAYGAVVALLAWAAYHFVDDATGTMGVFVAESLSAAAVAGLAALPIALFPVAGMPGASVFAWNRRVWAGCYAFGLFAFFVVLLPTPYAWDEVGWSLKGWVLAYVAYLAVALVMWWVMSHGHRDGPAGAPAGSTPEVEELGEAVASGAE